MYDLQLSEEEEEEEEGPTIKRLHIH